MAISLLRSMDKKHPSEPHVYLALLGVDPSAQGQGIGKFLLQPRLDHCDENGFPVYLETQKPENLPYYERFGFKVRDTVALERTPTIWSMWRDPR
jgi:GNAT superfamily N-acetyltransferase